MKWLLIVKILGCILQFCWISTLLMISQLNQQTYDWFESSNHKSYVCCLNHYYYASDLPPFSLFARGPPLGSSRPEKNVSWRPSAWEPLVEARKNIGEIALLILWVSLDSQFWVCLKIEYTLWCHQTWLENWPFIRDFFSYEPPFIGDFPLPCLITRG